MRITSIFILAAVCLPRLLSAGPYCVEAISRTHNPELYCVDSEHGGYVTDKQSVIKQANATGTDTYAIETSPYEFFVVVSPTFNIPAYGEWANTDKLGLVQMSGGNYYDAIFGATSNDSQAADAFFGGGSGEHSPLLRRTPNAGMSADGTGPEYCVEALSRTAPTRKAYCLGANYGGYISTSQDVVSGIRETAGDDAANKVEQALAGQSYVVFLNRDRGGDVQYSMWTYAPTLYSFGTDEDVPPDYLNTTLFGATSLESDAWNEWITSSGEHSPLDRRATAMFAKVN